MNRSLIHEAITAQATEQPDTTALVWQDCRLTYQTLDTAADDYAAELTERGVRPGQIVPILMDRSPEMVALQLAVLKTGAAYANLDPGWPAERQRLILDLIAPVLVISDRHQTDDRFACYRPADHDIATAARRARRFEPVPVAPDAPATVFFTSGTTGVPKGVLSPHQAVTRLFGAKGLLGFGRGHATPHIAALPWDMYSFELWGQLTTGGTVVQLPGSYLLPGTLRELVARHGVDTLWITATVFNLFVDEDPDSFTGLTDVITGGETASREHMRSFLDRHPGIALWNAYGPAESCMITTITRVVPADCDRPGGIPIGTAVNGTTVVLLDEADQPCPAGQEGELCIAGLGLATGYLGQPELTRDKFPEVELDGRPVRIYRTGDMAVADQDGVLHYRGRRDRQLKISGFRIELGEIEAAAGALPGVRNCLAFPVPGPDGTADRLALVYLAPGADDGDPLDVHAQLSGLLPAYLVPPIVRGLAQYPVTANGKVDTAALRELVRHARPAGRGRMARR